MRVFLAAGSSLIGNELWESPGPVVLPELDRFQNGLVALVVFGVGTTLAFLSAVFRRVDPVAQETKAAPPEELDQLRRLAGIETGDPLDETGKLVHVEARIEGGGSEDDAEALLTVQEVEQGSDRCQAGVSRVFHVAGWEVLGPGEALEILDPENDAPADGDEDLLETLQDSGGRRRRPEQGSQQRPGSPRGFDGPCVPFREGGQAGCVDVTGEPSDQGCKDSSDRGRETETWSEELPVDQRHQLRSRDRHDRRPGD